MDDLDYSSTSSDEMDHSDMPSPSITDELILYVIVINGSVKLEDQPDAKITFQPGENISYENLIAKIHQAFPFLKNENYDLTYKDDAGVRQEIGNDENLEEIMGGIEDKDGDYLLIYVLYNSDVDKSAENSFPSQYFCDNCCFALKHYRFKCKTCLEYDLCKSCKKGNCHGFHEFEYLDIVTSENAPLLEVNEIHIWSKYRIDEGAFGVVYTAYERTTNKKIAVKFFKDFIGDGPEVTDRFSRELTVYKVAGEHNNFVKVLGFCRDSYNFGLAMEHVTMTVNGKEISGLIMYLMLLRRLFKSGRKRDIDRKELDSFALQISRGMEHLEIRGVVHRNLAARNVLIDGNKNLKISDFGLSHSRVEYDVFGSRWSAPEVLKSKNYTSKSDVWAFGIVLWEIATLGGFPYDWLDNGNVKSYVKGGGRLRKPSNMSDGLYRIMSRCWAGRPENRPNFSDLVNKFLDFKWLPYCFYEFEDDDDFELPAALDLYERRVRFM